MERRTDQSSDLTMNFYQLKISYNGTGYLGYQRQGDSGKTIQSEIETAFEKIFKTRDVSLVSASRTDAGVHAFCQIAKIKLPFFIEPLALMKAMNSHLPLSIRVNQVIETTEHFHPSLDAKWKIYNYLFSNTKFEVFPFANQMLPNVEYELDFELMSLACKKFIGKHDFKSFSCRGTIVRTTVREIYDCWIEARPGNFWLPPHYALGVRGDGFLKQMVRLMVGTVIDIGRGRLPLDTIEKALARQEGLRMGPVAPPSGLYLVDVFY